VKAEESKANLESSSMNDMKAASPFGFVCGVDAARTVPLVSARGFSVARARRSGPRGARLACHYRNLRVVCEMNHKPVTATAASDQWTLPKWRAPNAGAAPAALHQEQAW
jgi:hypothetical protein